MKIGLVRIAVTAGLVVLSLIGRSVAGPGPIVTRGPYLQMPGPDTMTVVWHTDTNPAPPAIVNFGETLALGSAVAATTTADLMGGFKHVATLALTAANTKHYYQVADQAFTLTIPGDDYSFTTPPLPGTRQRIRIWTYGDSGYWPGRTGTEYIDTRAAYYSHVADGTANGAADATDVMLYLGDNAYVVGNDATYHSVFFSPSELQAFHRRQPFFSAAGNHESFESTFDSIAQAGHYFEMFEFPTANELGTNGIASGTEAYYSFDHGNIHFIVLDSENNIAEHAGAGAAMLAWLDNDLLATTADWIIAAWHRPPYSRGLLHDSDVEQNEIDMREQIVPILEDHGVDLILSGHSHTYERTPLIDGHHGLSSTLSVTHLLDSGDGDPVGDGAYHKASLGPGPHEGAVYVVTGAAADVRFFNPSEHPVMRQSIVSLGTSVIEVDGDVLNGSFLDETGAVIDKFRISKGFPTGCPTAPHAGCATQGKVKVVLKDRPGGAKDKATTKLKAEIADAGLNLNESANLSLCVYGGGNVVFSQVLPNIEDQAYAVVDPPSAVWTFDDARPGKYRYEDDARAFSGVSRMKIKTGAKGSLVTKASGVGVSLPIFPVAEPVTVQIFNSDGEQCWDVPVTVKKNESARGLIVKGSQG